MEAKLEEVISDIGKLVRLGAERKRLKLDLNPHP
jgi:hypothetical protein